MSMAPWPPSWVAVESTERRRGFEAELARELGAGHPLSGLVATAIAYRGEEDDALFALADGRVAEVHLTWRGTAETDPLWPYTTLYASLASWKESWKDSAS